MDDCDSVYADSASIIGSPASFRPLPTNRTPLHSEDFTNNSSQAVLDALKALQLKIKKLELEREQAEQNFESLEKEKEKCRGMLHRPGTPSGGTMQSTTTGTQAAMPTTPKPVPASEPEVDKENMVPTSTSTPSCTVTKTLYYPSSSKPYTTYISNRAVEEKEPVRDSRIGVLEKQLEYMRRMVHQAEVERSKAAEKVTVIEREREEQEKNSTLEEMRSQSRKIEDLERECSKLCTAHLLAEGKIKELEGKLEEETQCHLKQSGENSQLERISAENKHLMLNITPPPPSPQQAPLSAPSSAPPSPAMKEKLPCKKKRKKCASSSAPSSLDWKSMPFVAGQSSPPSHSLSANVQQMLSVLKQENPTLCARITTQKKSSAGMSTRDIKQVISGLEDDLGSLTIEYQTLKKGGSSAKLESVAANMKKKSQHISKLKSHLNKLKKEQSSKQTVVKARPSRPSTAKEYEISVRGSNTKELLSKVKAIKEVLSSRDLQWV